jgi:hypothetical protein
MIAIEDQARSIFLAALERAADQWPAFLDDACGANAELWARAGQLLHAHQAMGSIHGGGAGAPAAASAEPLGEGPGSVIGPYTLLEQIGEGGFAVVFVAEQTQAAVANLAEDLTQRCKDAKRRRRKQRFSTFSLANPQAQCYDTAVFLLRNRRFSNETHHALPQSSCRTELLVRDCWTRRVAIAV